MEFYASVLFLSLIAASAMVSTAVPKENDIRLMSMFPMFIRLGRVEVYHEGIWGSVCDQGFGVEAADVACRQWGYRSGSWGSECDQGFRVEAADVACRQSGYRSGANSLFSVLSSYGNGTGPFWLSNVRCIGTEAKLTDCPADPWGQNECSRDQEASIICRGARTGQVNPARGLNDMTEQLEEGEVYEEKEEELLQNLKEEHEAYVKKEEGFLQNLKDARELKKKELVAEILALLEDN